ncbi:MAG: TSUP family transporter [Clostridia bacterium]
MINLIAGFFSGVISGMGIGGGMILIPALVFFAKLSQHSAQGINLWYFIPTASVSLLVHTKNKNVEYKKSLPIIITGVPFSILGAYIAFMVKTELLGKLFGGFLVIFGIKEVYGGFTNKK